MERKRKIKDGHIVVENPLFQELPMHGSNDKIRQDAVPLYRQL